MAGMDLSGRRADRGVSVFWMILAMGVGVFALLAILVVTSEQAVEPVPHDEGAEIVVNEGETQVLGTGNSPAASNENDATFTGDTVTVGGPQPEGELSVEDVEVDVSPGDPVGGEVVDPEQAGTDADAGMEEAVDEGGAEAVAVEEEAVEGEADVPGEGEIVVDPDGTTAPVVPTPSGPEGRDDETIAEELDVTE